MPVYLDIEGTTSPVSFVYDVRSECMTADDPHLLTLVIALDAYLRRPPRNVITGL